MKDSEHLQWIHDRIVNVYGESENVDFLIRLREIIGKLNRNQSNFSPELKREIDRVDAMGEALLQHTEEIKAKTQYIWVTYDPLYERVVCVHYKLQSDCKKCKTIRKKRWKENSVYFLETSKFLIKP